MPQRSYYDILGVLPTASEEEIKAAYRALAWSPSATGDQAELKRINEAYATLSSPHRRTAYDQTLAQGAPPAADTVQPAMPPASPVEVEERLAKGPLLLRLWGTVVGLVWQIRMVRYVFIPMTLVLSVALIAAFFSLLDYYQQVTEHPTPTKTAIMDVVRQVPDNKYITVEGQADYEDGYSYGTKDRKQKFNILDMGTYVMLFTGRPAGSSRFFTGLLKPLPQKLEVMLKSEVVDSPFWNGATVQTTHYLDTTYSPISPRWPLVGMAAVVLGLLVLNLPGILRYAVFVARDRQVHQSVAEPINWPLLVDATGTFYPADGRGLRRFHAGASAIVETGSEAGSGYVVMARFRTGRTDRLYSIRIPPGSAVRVGVDYAEGSASAALAVRAGGQTIYLRLASVADARRLAQALTNQG